ncbi:pimeloyl-ACP methyl ester carboxylesterase [Streptomyces sp. LBL]|nr:pimeloyl-ACP methyl ester carboxylesterase [Streptomyces sp. LBL]
MQAGLILGCRHRGRAGVERERQVPLLAVWGAGDEIFGPDGARAFTRDLPDAEIHLVPGGGHFLLESHLDTVAGYVRGFLTVAASPA